MTMIGDKLHSVQARIDAARRAAGRAPGVVRLLAVSKTFGAPAVREAFGDGQTAFGENYIQEGVAKIAALSDLPIEWHCIGPIQSNKTRLVAENFAWVQSLDRLAIARRLHEQRPMQLPPLQVCIQVNIDGEASKSGVAPTEVLALAHAIKELPRLQLRGLMSIPQPTEDLAVALAAHQRARALLDRLNNDGFALDTLSMGMSADLEPAIQAGSTMVRIGTAIFGAR